MENAQGAGTGRPPGASTGATQVKEKVEGVVSGAKELLVEGAKARATGVIDDKKGAAAQELGAVAQALRGAAQSLQQGEGSGAMASYAESAAEQVDKVARYIREKDVQGLTRDAETFARRHPEVFLGGAFLAGIFAARFLKSSSQRQPRGNGGESAPTGYPGGYGTDATGGAGYAAGYGTGTGEPFNPPHVTTTGGQ
jgi:hypothetical protein